MEEKEADEMEMAEKAPQEREAQEESQKGKKRVNNFLQNNQPAKTEILLKSIFLAGI
jgi:hypothetical protein